MVCRLEDTQGIRRLLDSTFAVEPSGEVQLGADYGKVNLKGLTLQQAEQAIERHLQAIVFKPGVSVTFTRSKTVWRDIAVPESPYRIDLGEFLDIQVLGTFIHQPINGTFVVEPSGDIQLGPDYGRIRIEGLTSEEAEDAIASHLRTILNHPEVSVMLAGWKG